MTRLIPDTSALWRLNIPRDRKETAADKLRAGFGAVKIERTEK